MKHHKVASGKLFTAFGMIDDCCWQNGLLAMTAVILLEHANADKLGSKITKMIPAPNL